MAQSILGMPVVMDDYRNDIPMSLYVHVPWCEKKCLYCDFNSHPIKGSVPQEKYFELLLSDLEVSMAAVGTREIESVFFGGGTPSVIAPELYQYFLERLQKQYTLKNDIEITLEANPGTSDWKKFRDYRAAGINRLSIGIQTFDDDLLRKIGRVHSSGEAQRAIADARGLFDNLNVDLMFALPGQKLTDVKEDLQKVLDVGPDHISIYQLTIEPNTWFARFPPALPADDVSSGMQFEIESVTGALGYENYEVSAFAKDGFRCRHNLNYWQFGDYLGIGAGAHSKLTSKHGVVRSARFKQPKKYMESAADGNQLQSKDAISSKELPFEFFMNGFRLREGVSIDLFESRTGLSFQKIRPIIDDLCERGLTKYSERNIKTTNLGSRFLNDVLQQFL